MFWETLLFSTLLTIPLFLSIPRSIFCSLDTLRPSLSATDTAAAIDVAVENIPIAVAIRMGPEMMSLFSRTRVL